MVFKTFQVERKPERLHLASHCPVFVSVKTVQGFFQPGGFNTLPDCRKPFNSRRLKPFRLKENLKGCISFNLEDFPRKSIS
jgi:hypothetical protein